MRNAAIFDALTDCEQTSPKWADLFRDVVDRLRRHGAGTTAPRVDERFPDFALPDGMGGYRTLHAMLSDGPVVLSFNRGGWCPYCRRELAGWASRMPMLASLHARFVAVVPEVDGRLAVLRDLLGGRAEVLCDVDHGVALRAGLAFRSDPELRRRYLACGLDLGAIYGSDSWFLTVPATFAIDRGGIVRFAFVEPDFRLRADPAAVIAALS
ncbi:peroxiredoxin-like family protein [Sphingomonas montana]|uniref:peroxiredoxin-like family protein n=1 Tax=Sphingomonas montana TaxID=1843236 RepID=UPI0009F9C041|nr:peroxiredoxin-like family protein [Sphingomonas montana]